MATSHRTEVLPRTIRKVIVTLVVGGSSFALTNMVVEEADLVWSVTLSVFIGGVVFVVQFMVDADNLLQTVQAEQYRHHAALQEAVERGFNRVSEATELFDLVESSTLPTDVIHRFVRNAATLGPAIPSLARDLAQAEIGRVSQFLHELSQGVAIHEGEDREWLLTLSAHAAKSIDAVSIPVVDAGAWDLDGGFWTTDLGQRYLETQRERVQKGVRIRRIFVLDRSDRQHKDLFRRIYRWQSELGIQTRVLDADAPTTPQRWLSDFIVFDGVVSYETTAGPNLARDVHMIISTQLVLDPARVETLSERFNLLWEQAQELE
ncbi:hypothetical protein HNP84_008875 [Thermocatellispora tengchongensis]|uniref:DUF6879 domain-containing protein n=1 Tax=Thermocatellispora tengchongensis TaxID=1073253 RepID=A0A840PJ14_9ACTN|nr:DUF6879 family protein [Thermocatellispora tengchongensis]MBB5139112.1 hypothetical protein [Thermocatellispora tengchongensis]